MRRHIGVRIAVAVLLLLLVVPAAAQAQEMKAMRHETVQRLNHYRVAHGLRKTTYSYVLNQIARRQARRIARSGVTHAGFHNRLAPYRRIGGVLYGEVLASGWSLPGLPVYVVRAWLRSPPHRAVITHPRMREYGASVYKRHGVFYYCVLMGAR
ncbi:MAG TPA: CAP domain-containing protein [Thermoleophilia bacterium]|nr:CAP domain-containing protein [Thermoleophilia bacterium]